MKPCMYSSINSYILLFLQVLFIFYVLLTLCMLAIIEGKLIVFVNHLENENILKPL